MPRRSGRSVTESIVKQSGSPRFLGAIVATTTKNNHTTAAPFNDTGNMLLNKILLVQPDAECYVLPCQTQAGTVTTANGVHLFANERVIICMDDTDTDIDTVSESFGWLACVSASGTTNLKVWELV